MSTPMSLLLTAQEVCAATCQARTTLHLAVKRGDFPKPVRVGVKRIAWRLADVQRWVDARPSVNSGGDDEQL